MKNQKSTFGNRVYIAGVWDILHIGHKNILRRCATYGKLVVGVATDDYVMRYKKKEPYNNYETRKAEIEKLLFVWKAIPHDEKKSIKVYEEERITHFFIGEDYSFTQSHFDRLKEAIRNGIRVGMFPYTEGISSTMLRKELKNANKK